MLPPFTPVLAANVGPAGRGMPKRPRQPLDGWNPYGEASPDRPKRQLWSRFVRISLPGLVALLAFGHDLLRIFEPLSPAAQTTAAQTKADPTIVAGTTASGYWPGRPETTPVDPRKLLPRGAKTIESPTAWFTPDDYPSAAVRDNLAGRVRIKFRVDPDGRVRTCIPVITSGSPVLDQTTCGIYEQHARYWPARDRHGHAISEVQTQGVSWVLPAG